MGPWFSRRTLAIALGTGLLTGLAALWTLWPSTSVHRPAVADTANAVLYPRDTIYDLFGRGFTQEETDHVRNTPAGRIWFDPAGGGVPITPEMIDAGADAFWTSSFGNEAALAEGVGLFDGALRWRDLARAIQALNGRATTNLQVILSKPVEIGGRRWQAGDIIDTGLDVTAGAELPLGLRLERGWGRLRAGVTCALCHATLDPASGKILTGVPNSDLNLGLLLALAPRSRAYAAFTGLSDLRNRPPPAPDALETGVDSYLMAWPPGSMDTTPDLAANPVQIPGLFVRDKPVQGWTGFAAAGPFRGLPTAISAHAGWFDPWTLIPAAPGRAGMTVESYERLMPEPPARDVAPRTPGSLAAIRLPTHPRPSLLSPDGLWLSEPGRAAGQTLYELSAWLNLLSAPPSPVTLPPDRAAQGRALFERAGCGTCHAGPTLAGVTADSSPTPDASDQAPMTVLPVTDLGTDPSHAAALATAFDALAQPASFFPATVPVPLPQVPTVLEIPDPYVNAADIARAWGHGGGGYAVPGLDGLYWTAPYLHDGGVAIGPGPAAPLGIPGTLLAGIRPDPAESLRALLDRNRRARVVAANRAAGLDRIGITGAGHDYWADAEASFTAEEQKTLIEWLLSGAGVAAPSPHPAPDDGPS